MKIQVAENGARSEVGETLVSLAFGILFSQPILFAFVGSFVAQRFYIRLPLLLLLLCLVACAAETRLVGIETHGMMLGLDVILFPLGTLAFLPLHNSFRWRLKQPTTKHVQTGTRTFQFGTKHLLIFTTIIAIVCGALRTLYVLDPEAKTLLSPADVITGIGLTCILFIPVSVIPWVVLSERSWRPVSVITAIVIWIVLNLAVSFSMAASTLVPSTLDPYRDIFPPLLLIGLGSGLSTIVTTLVLRFCGFRMVREPRIQQQT